MKTFFLLIVVSAIAYTGYYAYLHKNDVEEILMLATQDNTIDTFENTFSSEELLNQQAKYLLPSKDHTIASTSLLFCPHIFLQIKYSPDNRTTIGSSMLWN
jgi:hypothetical protein